MTKEERIIKYIEKARVTNGDKYDYTEFASSFLNVKEKIPVICPEHGKFFVNIHNHINLGSGCPECNPTKPKTLDYYIGKFKEVHGEKYDYSQINREEYKGASTLVKILCPLHGPFMQKINEHLHHNCQKCGIEKLSRNIPIDYWIKRADTIHNNAYDYSKTHLTYKSGSSKVEIICPNHGPWWQTFYLHTHPKAAYGCKYCGYDSTSKIHAMEWSECLRRFKEKHGDKYSYVEESYVNFATPMTIICPKHKEFQQIPYYHAQCECPKCASSWTEKKIIKWLDDHNIPYKTQKTYPGLYGEKKRRLRFDFYFPELNLLLEFDGIHHFRPLKHQNGQESFEKTQKYDKMKDNYCLDHGIHLIRVPYWEAKNLEEILTRELLTEHLG